MREPQRGKTLLTPARARPRRRVRPSAWLMAAVGVGAAVAIVVGLGGGGGGSGSKSSGRSAARPARHSPRLAVALRAHVAGRLAAAEQDAAAAGIGDRAVLMGGLTAADSSRSDAIVLRGARPVARGVLPSPLHDAAAVALGGSVYFFGGGNLEVGNPTIVRVDPSTARAGTAGRLPVGASDVGASALGRTAYVVAGYTGMRPLDTGVAWRPG